MEIEIGCPQLWMMWYLFLNLLMLAHYKSRTQTVGSFVGGVVIAYPLIILIQWWGGFWTETKDVSWHAPQFISAFSALVSIAYGMYLVTDSEKTVGKGLAILCFSVANITILAFGGYWGVRFIP